MTIEPVQGLPGINSVTDYKLLFIETSGPCIVEINDSSYKRVAVRFGAVRAIRVLAMDCFIFYQGLARHSIQEVIDSPWIEELRSAASRMGQPRFLDGTHHFVIPAYDDVIEVVAKRLEWSYL